MSKASTSSSSGPGPHRGHSQGVRNPSVSKTLSLAQRFNHDRTTGSPTGTTSQGPSPLPLTPKTMQPLSSRHGQRALTDSPVTRTRSARAASPHHQPACATPGETEPVDQLPVNQPVALAPTMLGANSGPLPTGAPHVSVRAYGTAQCSTAEHEHPQTGRHAFGP